MSLHPNSASLVKFVIQKLIVKFFGVFLLEQNENVPVFCEVLRLNFLENQYSNSNCSTPMLNEK